MLKIKVKFNHFHQYLSNTIFPESSDLRRNSSEQKISMLRIFIRLRVFWWNFFYRNGIFLFYCRSVAFCVSLFSDFSVISKSQFEMTKMFLFRFSLSCLSYLLSVFRFHAFFMFEVSVLSFIPLFLWKEKKILQSFKPYISNYVKKNDINFLQTTFQDF